jgi:hypothetical protein
VDSSPLQRENLESDRGGDIVMMKLRKKLCYFTMCKIEITILILEKRKKKTVSNYSLNLLIIFFLKLNIIRYFVS